MPHRCAPRTQTPWPDPGGLTRRAFVLALAFGSAACTRVPVLGPVQQAFRAVIEGQPDVPLTRAAVAKLPYASIRAKMGKGGRVFMVLARYQGPDLVWVSADRAALATRAGRLVETAGLPENLKHTEIVGADPVATGLHALEGPTGGVRFIDLEKGDHYGVRVESRFVPGARETLEILGLRFAVVRVREHNTATQLDWAFDNVYWADAHSGFVWKSVQHATPGLPPIEIEILKPAAVA